MKFVKATKEQAKLRLALFGPSGSGKTFSALRIATGLGGRIALIDTERGSASKYADLFSFDVLELDQFGTRTYIEAIGAAQRGGYDVLIIDSLTHGWHDLLQEVERIARAKFGGNTWAAWSEGTPLQRAMVDAILRFDGHIIATMRTKTEWIIVKDAKGRDKPERIGLAPEQGKGIEYEFDMLMEINAAHYATVTKDRTTGRCQDKSFVPDENFGIELTDWLTAGASPRERPKQEAIKEELSTDHNRQAQPSQWKQDGPTGKRPPVKKGVNWVQAATELACRYPYYQNTEGQPDWFCLLETAGKLGWLQINGENLDQVLQELEAYANG